MADLRLAPWMGSINFVLSHSSVERVAVPMELPDQHFGSVTLPGLALLASWMQNPASLSLS